ncbi:peptide deformylase [Rhizobium sp. 32-5/1]|uniref:peptide deformylase n=1 Tax=Rhizobium sp. 32-5/1 TaxID=3019602 RepID=UPI00240D88B7|nr:peptide deformylase [Rhizobium sp. 32-5/1]WEZ83684.1 peptide deformylase [Rhizobium sp. 32-5/1]
MATRPILRFPHPLLRTAAAAVDQFDDALAALAQDLLETMRAAPGIGITAPHIGILQRLMVIEIDAASGVRIYVNPEVTSRSTDITRHVEGSVSMPGVTEEVERQRHVSIRFQTLDGAVREEEAEGLLAICLQHEIDQLDGIFWTQRLSRLKRERITRRFEKLHT